MESAATSTDSTAVERQLDALEATGARSYDAPACDCVRELLTRAEELGGGVGELLVARAHTHLCALRERFEQDKRRVQSSLEKLEAQRGPHEELHQLLQSGELLRVARAVRRIASHPAGLRPLAPQPAQRGTEAQRGTDARRGVMGQAMAERRRRAVVYEDSVAALVASLALARAVDVVPEDAGPYNPLRIASETLDRLRDLSPFYLTVQLNRLEELASLLSLPELPQPAEEKALPRKKTRVLRGGRA